MSEEAKEGKKAEPTPDSGSGQDKSSKIVLILTGLNLLLVLGIGAVVFMQFQKEKHKETVADIQPHAEEAGAKAEGEHGGGHGGAPAAKKGDQVLTLEQFTVNLATSPGTPPRYARVIIALEVPNAETAAEVNQKMAPVRNAIIDLFNSKRPGDLQTGEGKNYLKEEIRNALNSFLVSGKVKSVFFSNFAVSN